VRGFRSVELTPVQTTVVIGRKDESTGEQFADADPEHALDAADGKQGGGRLEPGLVRHGPNRRRKK
jgi:hypothetical protein